MIDALRSWSFAAAPWAVLLVLFFTLWLVIEHLTPLAWRSTRRAAFALAQLAARWSWIARNAEAARKRFPNARVYFPAAVVIIVSFGVALVAGDIFFDLAELLMGQSPLLGAVDTSVHAVAREIQGPSATLFFRIFTSIGDPIGAAIVVTVAALALVLADRRPEAIYLVFVSAGGGIANLILKAYFARARPELAQALVDQDGYAFPSGHALGAVVVYGALAFLAIRIVESWRLQSIAVAAAVAMILAISVSRVYLGVHWISDIAGGLSAGALWLASVTIVFELFERVRPQLHRGRKQA